MSSTRPIPPDSRRTFDRIAPVYDRTRGALDDRTADALASAFLGRGERSVLEIGVGTGRVSVPLAARGLDVTGLDPSRAMLARASGKGRLRLLQGSAYRLPFREGRFDAVLFAHVLHLLDRPEEALREAARVSRGAVAALVSLRDDRSDPEGRPREDDLRKQLHDLLRTEGVAVPPFFPPWKRERELLERFPPTELLTVSDRTVVEPAERRIEVLELRGYRNLLDVPPEALERATAVLRTRFAGRNITARRVYALARWSRAAAAHPTGGSGAAGNDGAAKSPVAPGGGALAGTNPS